MSGQISLDGGSWANLTNSISEHGYGWYKVTLTQSETNANIALVRIVSSTTGIRINPIILHFTNYTETKASYLDATISSRSTLTDAQVWGYSSRTLTSFGTLVTDIADAVWNYVDRTLTSFGTLVDDIAAAVWGYVSRTLTSFGTLTADIWGYVSRSLTDKTDFQLITDHPVNVTKVSGVSVSGPDDFKADVSALALQSTLQAVKAKTDNLPSDPASQTDINALEPLLRRVLGLAGENVVVDQVEVDSTRKITSARIRIYDSKANAEAKGNTGKIAEFALSGTWLNRVLQEMLVVNVST